MELLKTYGLISKNGFIYLLGKKKPIEEMDLWSHLKAKGVDFKDMDAICTQLKEEASSKLSLDIESKDSKFNAMEFKAKREIIFETCIYKTNLKTLVYEGEIHAYVISEEGWKPMGLASDLNADSLVKCFSERHAADLRALSTEINDLSYSLNGPHFNHERIAEQYIDDTIPSSIEYIDSSLQSAPYPLLLKGDQRPAIRYLPYDTTAPAHLNSALEELLSRMSGHTHFCAYLFQYLLGYETQQLLYIYGEGGDGKSSLLKLLAEKTQSLTAYSEGSRHSYYAMFDKAIISLSESTEKHILLKPQVKLITGGDAIQIEAKYKNSFTGRIKALFIIDSNNRPYVLGQESETRRLRIFEMKSPKGVKPIPPKEYVTKLSENFDGFISYCKQCYEQLKNPDTQLVRDPDNLQEVMKQLKDKNAEMLYDTLIKKLIVSKNFILKEDANIKELSFRGHIHSMVQTMAIDYRQKFFIENFFSYLRYELKIQFKEGIVYGIGKLQDLKTNDKSEGTVFIKPTE